MHLVHPGQADPAVLSANGALAPVDVRERDPRVPEHLADLDLTH